MQLLVARRPVLGACLRLGVAELFEHSLRERVGAGVSGELPLAPGKFCDGSAADDVERTRAGGFEDLVLRTEQEATKRRRVTTEHEASRNLHARNSFWSLGSDREAILSDERRQVN